MIIKRFGAGIILAFMILFLLSGMFLLSFSGGAFNMETAVLGVIFAVFIIVQYNVLKGIFKHLERFSLLSLIHIYCVCGGCRHFRMRDAHLPDGV